MLEYIEELVDIYVYPKKDRHHLVCSGCQITLGDLHGNAMKLLYSLVRHGYINAIKDDYNAFCKLYIKAPHTLTLNDINNFNALLDKMAMNPQAQGCLVRLIGDVLADRGSNDYFTLKILEKLCKNNIEVEILL